jgi:lipopolysaccharide export LptBFGC system permease protein LptF
MLRGPLPLLPRYILAEILLPFVGALLFFVFVLLMFQIINLVDFFVVHKIPTSGVIQLLGYLALSLLQPASPVACLLASITWNREAVYRRGDSSDASERALLQAQ